MGSLIHTFQLGTFCVCIKHVAQSCDKRVAHDAYVAVEFLFYRQMHNNGVPYNVSMWDTVRQILFCKQLNQVPCFIDVKLTNIDLEKGD